MYPLNILIIEFMWMSVEGHLKVKLRNKSRFELTGYVSKKFIRYMYILNI